MDTEILQAALQLGWETIASIDTNEKWHWQKHFVPPPARAGLSKTQDDDFSLMEA